MLIELLLLVIGLCFVIFGADALVDGSSSIARRLKISEFVIGLTIVGFGTSCPELVVSLTGAFAGNSDISMGNVVGSNIFNSLLILGITALINPIVITKSNKRQDIPLLLLVTVLLITFAFNKTIFNIGPADNLSRIEGIILLFLFVAYIFLCFKNDKSSDNEEVEAKSMSMFKAIVFVILGLAGLVVGGRLFVDSATHIARMLNVSDKFIAITILAGGTSLPELATCIVAAIKKKNQLALGNILGSNVFNILLILGSSALIHPLSMQGMNLIDMGVLAISAIFIATSVYTAKRNTIDRFDASIMLLFEAAYLVWLFSSL